MGTGRRQGTGRRGSVYPLIAACSLITLGFSACSDVGDVSSGGFGGAVTTVGGGIFCGPGADADADGIPDLIEGLDDVDGDSLPNYRDDDSDGDGLSDAVEIGAACNPNMCDTAIRYLTADSDGDGIVDGEDSDVCTGLLTTAVTSTGMSQTSTATSATTGTSTTGSMGNDSTTASSNGEGGTHPGAGGADPNAGGAAGAAGENSGEGGSFAGGAAGATLD